MIRGESFGYLVTRSAIVERMCMRPQRKERTLMRKKRNTVASRRPVLKKRELRLSKETVRTLTSDDLLQAAGGCPYDSTTGTEGPVSGGAGNLACA